MHLINGVSLLIAPIARRMFEDYAMGKYSLANLAEMAKREGFRQPFDPLAGAAAITREEKAVGALPDGLHQGELPGQDSNLEKQDQNLL